LQREIHSEADMEALGQELVKALVKPGAGQLPKPSLQITITYSDSNPDVGRSVLIDEHPL